MKKSNIITVFILLFINSNSYSQIVIDKTDMPSGGKYYYISNNVTLDNTDYTITGTDYNWDFSKLTPATQSTDSFVSVNTTPLIFQLIYNSIFDAAHKATVAQPQNTLNFIPSINLTDVFTFYQVTDKVFSIVGYGAYLNTIPLPLKYDNADIIYKLPLKFGDIDSNTAKIELSIPNTGYFGQVKKRKDTADGWGTITTPFGTFQTLRIKSVINEKDSIHFDTLSINPPAINRSYTVYSWLSKSYADPILQVTDNGLTQTVAYIDNIFTNVREGTNINSDIRIYPNPSFSRIYVSYYLVKPSCVEISISDLLGDKICNPETYYRSEGLFTDNIDLTKYHLNKGLYFLKVSTNNGTRVVKFVKE
jgi:hypothetical protein